jgi:hypothetical protein
VSIDPAAPAPTTTDGRHADRLAELERRVVALERGNPTISVGAGAPSSAPRDGAPYVDSATPRLYLRVGGTWRYTTLT